MMTEHNHIIEKVNVEVDVPDMSTARHIQDNVKDLLYSNVLPQLEAMLNGVCSSGQLYRADKLTLDLDFDSKQNFDEKFSSKLLESLGKILTSRLPEGARSENEEAIFEKGPATEKQWQVFLYFLRTGTLPWFAVKTLSWLREEELLQYIAAASAHWKNSFDKVIRNNVTAQRRMVMQFSVRFVADLIGAYAKQDIIPSADQLIKNAVDATSVEKQKLRALFLNSVLEYLFNVSTPVRLSEEALKKIAGKITGQRQQWNDIEKEQPKELLISARKKESDRAEEKKINDKNAEHHEEELADEKLISGSLQEKKEQAYETPAGSADREKTDDAKKTNGEKKRLDGIEGIYVRQAGLVLLHPFLLYFFKELSLLEGDQFKDVDAQQTAVHLLHYLATGKDQCMEYDLLMEKYLCGFDPVEPIERFMPLTEAMKAESEQLLLAAIGHWDVLKNTSTDGLREAFLQRNGKLVPGDYERLIVEGSGIDILLEHLPWSFSLIKLPWMRKILYVDWSQK